MEGKTQKRLQEVSANQKGLLVHTAAIIVGLDPHTPKNRANPQKNGCGEGNPIKKTIVKEIAERLFTLMEILPDVSSQRK